MLTLYHLAISHYSEKARWALEHKGLEYRSKVLAPGYHMLTVMRIAGSRTVPVLTDSGTGAVIDDSTDILRYLERIAPDPALFPDDDVAAARVAEIEEFFDERCARHVSGFLYHHLLAHPRVLRQRWAAGLPLHRRLAVRLLVPLARRVMRRSRGITAAAATEHRRGTIDALDRLATLVDAGPGEFLVGDRFSAADLTAASLLAPAVRPRGSPWSGNELSRSASGYPPPELTEFYDEVARHPAAGWVRRIWDRARN